MSKKQKKKKRKEKNLLVLFCICSTRDGNGAVQVRDRAGRFEPMRGSSGLGLCGAGRNGLIVFKKRVPAVVERLRVDADLGAGLAKLETYINNAITQ